MLEGKISCPNSPLCNWGKQHNWKNEKVYRLTPTYAIVDCFSCSLPMIVWFNCKEPNPASKLRTLRVIHVIFGRKAEIRGTRTKYDHPHEHIVLT